MNRPADAITSWRLGTRLFLAQAVVLLAIVATAGLVATFVGPPVFHAHLIEAQHSDNPPEVTHIEQAFADASMISVSAGLLVALCCALAISWYLTRRIGEPVGRLTEAARRVSGGDYGVRVAAEEGGPELATLGEAFNMMADRIENVENTRRRLLSDLAHEMRTPIATLNAHLEGIADGVVSWDDSTRRILGQQAERLTRLARDLDEVSRAEEGRILLDTTLQSTTDLVEQAIGQAERGYEAKGVGLVSSIHDAWVQADPQRMAQILGNLLSNALRHSAVGDRVAVKGTRTPDTVMITVSDTGQGMTDEQLAHIFERFYRGDAAREADKGGSGIGLTIARALAEAHGGTLTASSPGPGLGSTFCLTLPLAAPPS